MTQQADPAQALVDTVVPTLENFARSTQEIRTAFLTGSYVGGAWSREHPNLNVYFISDSDPGAARELRWALRNLWRDLRLGLRRAGIELLIDCHPYSVPRRDDHPDRLSVISITTKVLDGFALSNRYNLPPTIGPGWASRYRVLIGCAADIDLLAPHPIRDREWARTVHRAFSYYRNMIDHLPWAVDTEGRPGDLVEECARYAEEIYKDALALGLHGKELADGRHIEVLANGITATAQFAGERFGPAGSSALKQVIALKELARAPQLTEGDAQLAWREAYRVWDWAWPCYLRIARELLPGDSDFQRVDAFV